MDVKIILSSFLLGIIVFFTFRFRSFLFKHLESFGIIASLLLIAIGFAAAASHNRAVRWLVSLGAAGSGLYYISISYLFQKHEFNWKRSKILYSSLFVTLITIFLEDLRNDKTHFTEQTPTNPNIFYWFYHINEYFSLAIIDFFISLRYLQGVFQTNIKHNGFLLIKRCIGFFGWICISILFFLSGLSVFFFLFGNTLLYYIFTRNLYITTFLTFFVMVGFIPRSASYIIPFSALTPLVRAFGIIITLMNAFEDYILQLLHAQITQITPSVRLTIAPISLRLLPEISDARRRLLSHYPTLDQHIRAFHEAELIEYLCANKVVYQKAGPYRHSAIIDVRRHNLAVGLWLVWLRLRSFL